MTTEAPKKTARDLVQEFLTAFNHNPSDELCLDLIREETKEVAQAAADLLKEFCDLIYVLEQAGLRGVGLDKLDGQTLANIAILFKNYGHVFDPVFEQAFERVHESNMSKLVGGKPLRREDGKVLKGPNYKAPDLIDLI
jgi:predicted HAD superfamily Cof-like phosphohydrolase